MAVQQTVQIIGNSNNTIAEVTTTIDALLETPKACSLDASASVGVSTANLFSYPQSTSDQIVLSLRWEDAFSNAFIKKIRFGFNAAGGGTATIFTCKLFRVNNFAQQYIQGGVGEKTPTNLMIPTLDTGQTLYYSGTGGQAKATDDTIVPTSGSLVTMPPNPASGVPVVGLFNAIAAVDPIPLAAIVCSKRVVSGQAPGFGAGGFVGNLPMQSLWEISEGDYPIYLKKGEGIVLTVSGVVNAAALALGGAITLCFDTVPISNQEY